MTPGHSGQDDAKEDQFSHKFMIFVSIPRREPHPYMLRLLQIIGYQPLPHARDQSIPLRGPNRQSPLLLLMLFS
jgi:hypothetical protein